MKKIGALASLVLSGCALSGGAGLMDGIMASWYGAHMDAVVAQWGYPSGQMNVAGRKVYVWQRDTQLTMPLVGSTTGTSNRIGSTTYYSGSTTYTGGQTSTWTCARFLEVDAQEVVVRASWEGNNCPFLEAGPYSSWRRR